MGGWWASSARWPQSLAGQKEKCWDRGRGIRYPRWSRRRCEGPDGWGHERLRNTSYRTQGTSYWGQEEANREGSQPKYSILDGQVVCSSMPQSQKGWWDLAREGGKPRGWPEGFSGPSEASQPLAVVQVPVWHGPQDQCSWKKPTIPEVCLPEEEKLPWGEQEQHILSGAWLCQQWICRCPPRGRNALGSTCEGKTWLHRTWFQSILDLPLLLYTSSHLQTNEQHLKHSLNQSHLAEFRGPHALAEDDGAWGLPETPPWFSSDALAVLFRPMQLSPQTTTLPNIKRDG